MSFSTGQLLLLNCIMYMTGEPFPPVSSFQGRSLGELLSAVPPGRIDPAARYDCFITGGEWLKILHCFRREPQLSGMRIVTFHEDRGPGGGGGQSAVFLSPEASEAVVVFKGTQSSEEWGDNFAGVNLSDTPQQRNALQWFRQAYRGLGLQQYRITVTGHSKGGNKAKYVSILDERVSQCVSFDGQGFSDAFITKYSAQIASRQRLVENHNAEYDFVNFLFNQIGGASFYTASPLENAGLARNHSPAAMMHFSMDGQFRMVPSPHGQAEGIAALSRFSDSFFASLSPRQRETSYRTVEALRSAAFSMHATDGKDFLNVFLPLLAHPDHTDDLAYLLAYTVEYEQHFPEFIEQLRSLLVPFGLVDFTKYILLVDGILNLNLDTPFGTVTFDSLFDNISRSAQGIPAGLLAILIGWAASQGIEITLGQLRQLLAILPRVNDYMNTITIDQWGTARDPSPTHTTRLTQLSRSLERLGTVMGGSAPGQSSGMPPSRLRNAGSRLRTVGRITGQISSVLQQVQPEPQPTEDPGDTIDV